MFAASRDDHPHAFLLESLTGPERLREHTFVGFDPELIVSYRGGIFRSNGDSFKTNHPLDALRKVLRAHAAPNAPGPFVGGLVGYVSFEFVRNLDSVPVSDSSGFPEFEFGLYLDGVIVDHVRRLVPPSSNVTDHVVQRSLHLSEGSLLLLLGLLTGILVDYRNVVLWICCAISQRYSHLLDIV